MIIEIRPTHDLGRVILVPTPDEARIIESILGKTIRDDNGLICLIRGEYRLADGYGPAYLSLWFDAATPEPTPIPPMRSKQKPADPTTT